MFKSDVKINMLKMRAEADPWKVIVGLIIIIVCTLLILFFFTDKFNTGASKFKFDCWELEIPGKCFCPNQDDCATKDGRDKCRKDAEAQCSGK
jgi:hypothetical protein